MSISFFSFFLSIYLFLSLSVMYLYLILYPLQKIQLCQVKMLGKLEQKFRGFFFSTKIKIQEVLLFWRATALCGCWPLFSPPIQNRAWNQSINHWPRNHKQNNKGMPRGIYFFNEIHSTWFSKNDKFLVFILFKVDKKTNVSSKLSAFLPTILFKSTWK